MSLCPVILTFVYSFHIRIFHVYRIRCQKWRDRIGAKAHLNVKKISIKAKQSTCISIIPFYL